GVDAHLRMPDGNRENHEKSRKEVAGVLIARDGVYSFAFLACFAVQILPSHCAFTRCPPISPRVTSSSATFSPGPSLARSGNSIASRTTRSRFITSMDIWPE